MRSTPVSGSALWNANGPSLYLPNLGFITQIFRTARNVLAEEKTLKLKVEAPDDLLITVPESIIAFLESTDYEDAIRNAISLGGDADTMACIAGGIAEAFYGDIPDEIIAGTMGRLDERLRLIVREFRQRFVLK